MTRRWTPVFAASDYGPEQIALRYKAYTRSGTEGFVAAYRDILTHAGPAFGEVGRWLASEEATEGQGCVFHARKCRNHLSSVDGHDMGWLDGSLVMLTGPAKPYGVSRPKVNKEGSR